MAKMLKYLIQPPLIHPELLEEVEKMHTKDPVLERIFMAWKTSLEETYDSYFNVPVFKGFKNLNVQLRGSFGEDVDIPEYFILDKDGESSLCCSGGEIDCTATIKDFQVSEGGGENFSIEYVEEHPGFARLRIDKSEDINFWISHADIASDLEGKNKNIYLSPEVFVDEWDFILLIRNTAMTYGFALDKQFGIRSSQDEIYALTTQEGPAIKTTILVGTGERYQADTAIALKCLTWPVVAANWVTRKRESNWPSDALINNCVKDGCCFVPKSIEDSKTKLEWRVSFVAAESTLMKSLTRTQKACYRIFKGIWRVAFRAPAEKYVQSYHIKTIFLWYCEKVKSERFSKELIVPRIFDLLHYLRNCLIEKNCPQYFIPQNDLFAFIKNKVIVKTLEHVNIAISKANDIWIYNRGLFILPCTTFTRIAMSKETTKMFLDSLNKLVTTCISESLDLMKDKSNIKANIRNSDKITKSRMNAGGTHLNIIEKVQCLSNAHCIECDGNAGDAAVVPKRDIESDTVSEFSSDDGSDSGNDTAPDNLKETMDGLLLDFGNMFIELYSANADIDDEDRLFLTNLLFQIYSKNYYLTHDVLTYICARIPPKELMKVERFSKGHHKGIASVISYIGSCGWLLHDLTKFRKKGSVNYESEGAI